MLDPHHRVLIVDDDAANRTLLARLLGASGLTRLREESDGRAVVDAVRSFDPHLVLLDLHLGAVDGFTVLESLAESDRGFAQRAVLLLTGDDGPGVRRRAAELGARGVLTKPYDVAELRTTIDGLLDAPPATVPVADASGRREPSDPSDATAEETVAPNVERLLEELQAANRELQAANDARSVFLSRVSHELRTPLTAILGFGELLSMADLDDDEASWVTMVVSAGRHLLGLLDDVLDIARIDSGDVSLSLEPVSVDVLVAETLELMRPLADSRGVRLEVDLGAANSAYVQADRQRLRQILINLVSNAIKYNRPAGTATLGAEVTDDRLRLTITDTGAGLDPDQLARLFVAFERLSAAQHGIEGTGLGLVLSRRLAEAMGGTLEMASTPGTGTTASVQLRMVEPLALEDDDAHSDTVTETRAYAEPKRVLYVEDVVANIRLVEQILKRRPSVTLVPVMLGSTALELAERHPPDLVLLDLHLPDISGEEVLRRLHADPATRDVPVVILSADATSRQLRRLTDAGAATYLTKPISVRRLLEILDQTLDQSS